MTANEMRNLFKELYDGASAQDMGYDDIEVSRFLNLAQSLIINEKTFSNRNKIREGFEIGSKRDAELSNLKRDITLWYDIPTSEWVYREEGGTLDSDTYVDTDIISLNENSIAFEKLPDMLYILRDTCDIEYNGTMYRNINVKNANEDELNNILNSPFRKPDTSVIYRTTYVLSDNTDIIGVKLFIPEDSVFKRWNCTYIKRPVTIIVDILEPSNQVNCELDEIVHNDIVFKAVELALGSIGSQKFQVGTYNTKTNIN